MRTGRLHLAASTLVVGLLAGLLAGCAAPTTELVEQARDEVETGLAGVRGEVEAGLAEARDQVEGLTEDARFCLAVTRTVAAIESGSPTTAQEAAEEVLAQAPEELVGPADQVVEEVRRTLGEGGDLRAEAVREAAQRLLTAAAERCDPRASGG
ncbi:MAG: hypothetical protein ACLFS9_05650 [Nitriliruptoraceae bacterium]